LSATAFRRSGVFHAPENLLFPIDRKPESCFFASFAVLYATASKTLEATELSCFVLWSGLGLHHQVRESPIAKCNLELIQELDCESQELDRSLIQDLVSPNLHNEFLN
jgi:hypothetical protein